MIKCTSWIPCWKNYTRNMHVSCMFQQISCVLHHACFMHVPHTMYMHVSCSMHETCMENARNWDVFHACDMHEPCMLHACHSCHEWTMHEPCMHEWSVYHINTSMFHASFMQESCKITVAMYVRRRKSHDVVHVYTQCTITTKQLLRMQAHDCSSLITTLGGEISF